MELRHVVSSLLCVLSVHIVAATLAGTVISMTPLTAFCIIDHVTPIYPKHNVSDKFVAQCATVSTYELSIEFSHVSTLRNLFQNRIYN